MTLAHYFLALAYVDLISEQAAMAEFEKAIHSPDVTPGMDNPLTLLYIKKQQFAKRKISAGKPSRSTARGPTHT